LSLVIGHLSLIISSSGRVCSLLQAPKILCSEFAVAAFRMVDP